MSIPNSLDEIDLNQAIGSNEEEEEEELIFEYNPKITIEEDTFKQALKELRKKLKVDNRESLRASLNLKLATLDHNKWVQIVNSSHQKKLLEEERWIVNDMRDRVGEPTLMLEIKVEALATTDDTQPYTVQDRLKLMQEKNPHLEILMKKFDAMINY